MFDATITKEECVLWIREFFEKNGPDCNAVIGISGKTDEDNLGFTYEVLDRYIRTGIIDDPQIQHRINLLHAANLFKLQPMPSFDPHIKMNLSE